MQKAKMNKYFIGFFMVLFLVACGQSETYVPKPHGYPKLEFPEKKYQVFEKTGCPYTFEIPTYTHVNTDTISTPNPRKGWYNVNFLPFNATLHLTYYDFKNWDFFDSLVYDSRKLVNKHLQKADDIIEAPIQTLNPNQKGLIFTIQGNTATNYNFFVTDSSSHFLRGALYFNAKTEQDSIAPVYRFIKKDIEHMIQTLKWK